MSSEVIVLRGLGSLLFEILDKHTLEKLKLSVQDKNPIEIGSVYLQSKFENHIHERSMKSSLKFNPKPKNYKIPIFNKTKVSGQDFSKLSSSDKQFVWQSAVEKNTEIKSLKIGLVQESTKHFFLKDSSYMVNKPLGNQKYKLSQIRYETK